MINKKNTTDVLAFDRIPAFRKYELFMERYRSPVDDFILPHIHGIDKPKILDVGSGHGYLKYFFPKEKEIEISGVELDEKRIESCKKIGYKEIVSFNIEKETFPFEDNSFDIVVAMHVVEHLYYPHIAIKEMHRILKKGGLLIIGVPMHIKPVAAVQRIKEKIFPSNWWEHHQFYTMKSLRNSLSDYDIKDIRGFRLISSRKNFNWEDNLKFYQFNTWWGKTFPGLSSEVNVIIQK
jgi:SAM-dependent methyltransferase